MRIAGKWLSPKGHIVRWIDESVQRERDLLIVGGIISPSLRFMSNDSGSCCEEGFKMKIRAREVLRGKGGS